MRSTTGRFRRASASLQVCLSRDRSEISVVSPYDCVDKLTFTATDCRMETWSSSERGRGRAWVAAAAACFVLLRALIIVVSAQGSAFPHGSADVSAVSPFCESNDPARSGSPPHSADHHCILCAPDERLRSLDADLCAEGSAVPPPGSASQSLSFLERDLPSPRVAERRAGWSSRAPPGV